MFAASTSVVYGYWSITATLHAQHFLHLKSISLQWEGDFIQWKILMFFFHLLCRSVWAKKTRTWEMRPNPSVVSSLWNTQLSTESSPTGMTWKRSGITHSTTSCVSPPRNTPSSWPKLLSILKPTVRRWLRYDIFVKNHSTDLWLNLYFLLFL